jgi:signal transduction histidine kinase
MLSEFIRTNRDELIALTRVKVAKRLAPEPTAQVLAGGVPLFLDQLVERLERSPSPGSTSARMDDGAASHGAALLNCDYTVSELIHDYGDICQAITELASAQGAPITVDEFHTLNLCLDNAIAESVTAYTRLRDRSMGGGETDRLGAFAQGLQSKLSAAQVGFQAIRSGRVASGGSVASVVGRSLLDMTTLITRTLVEARLESGKLQRHRVHLRDLIKRAAADGQVDAATFGVSLRVAPMDQAIDVEVDPQILTGALANVLQNAIKFTRKGGNVTLRITLKGARVEIAVEDECGGLLPGTAEELRGALKRQGDDRSGLGLGLFISRKGVRACGGVIHALDVPGKGCVFTIDLPVMRLGS